MTFLTLLRSALLVALVTGLFACTDGGDGNTTTVSDTTGNTSTVTVVGENPVSIGRGEAYSDLGATAVDGGGGEVQVVTSGSVDTTVAGTYVITYTVTNDDGSTTTSTRTINVLDDTSPIITITGGNSVNIIQNTSYSDLGAVATDDGDSIDVVITGAVDTSKVGTYTITYTATDIAGNTTSSIRTVNVILGLDKEPPMATAASISTDEDNAKAIVLSGTGSELSALSYKITKPPGNGSLSGSAPNLTYTPATNYNGADSFAFTVSDGEKTSEAAIVSISVNAVNDTPLANNTSLTVNAGDSRGVELNGSDIDSINLVYVVTQSPTNGTLSGTAPNLRYIANADFAGSDSFKFIVSDGDKASEEAIVSITVLPIDVVNQPPVATAASVSTDEDNAKAITLGGTDPESSALSYVIATPPANGTLSGSAPEVTYTPNENYNGSDSFAFTVSDGEKTSAAATVSITVNAVNDVPVANDASLVAKAGEAKGVELTGSDLESTDLTYEVTEQPANGALSGDAPNLTYTANTDYEGPDSFKFTVSDSDNTSVEATILINVSKADVENEPPVATAANVSTDEDVAKAITLSGTDPESSTLSYAITTPPTNGVLSGSAPEVTYTPNENYNGSDSFAFTVSDDEKTSAAATVSITVNAVNDAPVANDASLAAKAGEAKGVELTGSDLESTDLTYEVTGQPANGALSGDAPNLTYTANADYEGPDSFKFTISDGDKTSAEAAISITVSATVLDRDDDGVPDDEDAFPDDPEESSDLDNDGTGDNADPDRDGDGVENNQDVFPNDASESSDLDVDGVGDNSDPDRDGDGVSNEDDFFPDDKDSSKVPTVKILTPGTLITVGSSPITVTGTIDDDTARLTVNGVDVSHAGGQFSVDVSLEEGMNSIVARGIDAKNHEGLATISVSLDKTPPHVTVQSLEDGQTVYTDKVSVGGLVNDIVRGAVTEADTIVRVNGQLASVTNRSYLAKDVQLVEGENTIEVVASDAVGNVGNKSIKVIYEIQTNNIIELVSGQSQSEVISSTLGEPLKVKLTSEGEPVADKSVVFRVIEGDGLLQPGTDSEANGAIAKTNENGEAIVSFKVGLRAGEGNHRVRARAVGFEGEVVFHASATYGEGNKAGVIAGNNQRGSVRQPLPQPFVLAVTDAGANLIPDADIEFNVTVGSGKFQNGETTYQTKTDKDGRASAHFTLGVEEGLDVQRVTATLVGTNAIAVFTVSGFIPGDPGQTSVVGVVLDNQDLPIPSVTIRVDGTTRQAVTDEEGQFTITEVPVGPLHLLVEGSTTTRVGEWPTLSYNIVTVPGVENPLASPIYLVELDMDTATTVGLDDSEITLPEMPGFKLKVKAGSVTFPDGTKTGKLSVTAVNANKIPMAPPNGMQPQFIVTIQPHGAKFDPPAELTLPNVDGHQPGAEVEMYSYDHDLEEFVTIGLGTVSKDGSIITSNVGVGVIKAGWHCGSSPGGSGCCEGGGGGGGSCPVCKKSESDDCSDGSCVNDDSQDPGQCKKCSGGAPVNDDSDDPGECKSCKNGSPEADPDGASCDDKKFCTSADGQAPGGDTCSNGVCTGKPIGRSSKGEAGQEYDFSALNKMMKDSEKFFEIVDTAPGCDWGGMPSITGGIKLDVAEECCESKQSMVDATGISGSIGVPVPAVSCDIPTPLSTGVLNVFVNVSAGGSFNASASGYKSECEENCSWEVAGELGIDLSGSVVGAVVHPDLLSVSGGLGAAGSVKVTDSCGKVDYGGCVGPLKGIVKFKFAGFITKQGSVTVPGTQHCL